MASAIFHALCPQAADDFTGHPISLPGNSIPQSLDEQMLDQTTSLSDLLAARLALLDACKWKDLNDLQCDEAMERLHHVQESILKLSFADPAAKLRARTTLLDSDDRSNFADNFKNRLFEALRSS